MPGRTYHINYHGNGSATIECAYLYPYCNQGTTASMEPHDSIPYNPDIANVFYRMGYIESWGRGIQKIEGLFFQGMRCSEMAYDCILMLCRAR